MPKHLRFDDASRDPLDSFTDREQVLELFEQFLETAQPGKFRLLSIKGNSGTGKTFLISYLVDRICPKLGWRSGRLSFAQLRPDFRYILDGLEDALKGCVPQEYLKEYRTLRKGYNDSFNQYRALITINASIEAKDHSSISGVTQSIQVNAQLHERELQLRAELSRALVELAEKAELPLCIFIDSYERLADSGPELVGWLWEEVSPGLVKASPQPMLIVTCGWEQPRNPAITPFFHPEELADFDQLQVRSYLEKQGVIIPNADSPSSEQEELVSAFYDLTRGHPLVLGLAVTYFNQLDIHERNAQSLRVNRPLVDDRAQVEFLQDRLLSHLSEPYRTLLEHGPILRYFDQSTLRAILSVEIQGAISQVDKLDDRAYERFLQYPFIKRVSKLDRDPLNAQPAFHDLVRRVQLETLRRHHPETKMRLHRKMAEISGITIETNNDEQEREKAHSRPGTENSAEDLSQADTTEWIGGLPDEEFRDMLEYFYHALQVTGLQSEAFEAWEGLTEGAVKRWQRRQAGLMLEVVRQVAEEGDPFLSKDSDRYGRFLVCYSSFLAQEARWEEARTALEEAVQILEHMGNRVYLAISLNNLGLLYLARGKLEEALNYFERALAIREREGHLAAIALCLNNIGATYKEWGKLDQALSFHERALAVREAEGDNAGIAQSLNNIGVIYDAQEKFLQASSYYERALTFEEYIHDPTAIASYLNNLGLAYLKLGKTGEALSHFQRALTIGEQLGSLAAIGRSLHNLGIIHQDQGEGEEALSYYKRALTFLEQESNPTALAATLNNIGSIYSSLGELEDALSYYKRSLALREQVGDPTNVIQSLKNIAYTYREQGEGEEALSYYKRALVLGEEGGNPSAIASCLNKIGDIYREQGEGEEALSYYKRALIIEEQGNNSIDIAVTLNSIGYICASQENREEALSYFTQALTYFEQANSPANKATCHYNIGTIYALQGRVEEALNHHKQALILYEQESMLADVAESLNDIGDIYQEQGKEEEALGYYERALAFKEQVGNSTDISALLSIIGHIHRERGQLEEALDYYERALAINTQEDNLAISAANLNNIGFIYYAQGKVEEALGYFEQALAIKERIGNPAAIIVTLDNIGAVYDSEGKLEEALRYYARALSLREQEGNPADIAQSFDIIGLTYQKQGKLEEALNYHQQALVFNLRAGYLVGLAKCFQVRYAEK